MDKLNTNTRNLKMAAEWLVRLQDSSLQSEELLEWEHWISENPLHRQAFDDIERLSRRTDALKDKLADISLPTAEELAEDDYTGSESVLTWLDGRTVIQNNVARFVRRASPHQLRALSLAATLAFFAIGYAMLFDTGYWKQPTSNQLQAYETAESEHRLITLTDGSVISIGAKSSLSVNYTRDRRAVVLEKGEALFTVARNPARPFVVIAGSGTITAVGTAFNVRHDTERVVVTVTEGKVEIEQPGNKPGSTAPTNATAFTPAAAPPPAVLVVGQQLSYNTNGMSRVEMTDPTIATAWQSGRLQYRGEALKYVIKGVNRYSSKEIIIVDKQLEGLLFTGSVFQNQADEWLQGLTKVFPVELVETSGNKVLLAAREVQQAN